MKLIPSILTLAPLGLFLAAFSAAQEATEPHAPSQAQPNAKDLPWTVVEVEHLLNRAAFGAGQKEIQRWQEAGPEALVAHLLAGGGPESEFKVQVHRRDNKKFQEASADERRSINREYRQRNVKQEREFAVWWVNEMVSGSDPLRERMTLILHGWLVSGSQKVRRSDYIIEQNKLLRQYALGNYGALLRKILQDPAMLLYLDNNLNRKGKPNENLARELLELFSLGVGNYTEEDIKNAARALTGYTVSQDGFRYALRQHDKDFKTILGKSERFGADGLVNVILEQDACAEYLVNRIIFEFEGQEPEAMRLRSYAKLLRDSSFELEPLLRRLFLDPAFYRSEVLGTKVLSPVEYMVGSARRLGGKVPSELLYASSTMLGQKLLDPPSVKGWDGGFAWMTESAMMLRSNAWGAILGEVTFRDLKEGVEEALDMMDEMMDGSMEEDTGQETMPEPKRRSGPMNRLLGLIRREKLSATVPVVAWLKERRAFSDKEVAEQLLDELLAIPVPEETRARIQAYIKSERKTLDIPSGKMHVRPKKSKPLLMRTIHLILSLPEAQLG